MNVHSYCSHRTLPIKHKRRKDYCHVGGSNGGTLSFPQNACLGSIQSLSLSSFLNPSSHYPYSTRAYILFLESVCISVLQEKKRKRSSKTQCPFIPPFRDQSLRNSRQAPRPSTRSPSRKSSSTLKVCSCCTQSNTRTC